MPEHKLEAHKITKPIQLLAAWLVGLIVIDGSFLAAAGMISTPSWIPAALTIAAIINVPLFLVCIFLLQTKFRPEMQEDDYYAKYLENRVLQVTGKELEEPTVDILRADLQNANKTTLTLIKDLNSNLKGLTEDFALIQSEHHDVKTIQEKLAAMEQRLDLSTNKIETFEKQVDWQRSRIFINDLIPGYSHILKEIEKLGAKIEDTFGSSSAPPEIPKKLLVSFDEEVNIDHLRALLPLLFEHGFEYLDFSPNSFEKGTIYIGSYMYKYPDQWAKNRLDDKMLSFLKNKKTTTNSFLKRLVRSSTPKFVST